MSQWNSSRSPWLRDEFSSSLSPSFYMPSLFNNHHHYQFFVDTRWLSWLRHCVTSRKAAGSIPDVIGIIHRRNPSSRTMALGLTQPLTEINTTNVSWGVKVAGIWG